MTITDADLTAALGGIAVQTTKALEIASNVTRLSDLYRWQDHRGTTDNVVRSLGTRVQGEFCTLPTSIDDLRGTILSPAQVLTLPDGRKVPGALYHGFVSVEDVFTRTSSDVYRSQGTQLQLSPFVVALNAYVQGLLGKARQTGFVGVREQAGVALAQMMSRVVLDRKEGFCLTSHTLFHPGLGEAELGVPLPQARKVQEYLTHVLGADKVPTDVRKMSGLHVLAIRFPVINIDGVTPLRIRVIESESYGLYILDSTIKRMGGDYDGDGLFVTFAQNYLTTK